LKRWTDGQAFGQSRMSMLHNLFSLELNSKLFVL
jgi:hypothetical protein